jgi:hypothetical protein
MPESEPMVILEKQVLRLLQAVKRLKDDNVHLHARVKDIHQQLTVKKTQENRWISERSRVEAKVRKLIADLDTMSRAHVED